MNSMISLGATLAIALLGSAESASGQRVVSDGQTLTVRRGTQSVVRGSGVPARETRPIAGFKAVLVDDGANVEIVIGPRYSLQVEADDNLIGRVATFVENDQLRIGVSGSYSTNSPPTVRLTTPSLSEVVLRSSSDARLDGFVGGALHLASNGSGRFVARGRLDSAKIELNGSGGADLAEVSAADVDVVVNGSGDAVVRAANSLTAAVHGSGRITYLEDPARIRTAVHGTGVISRVVR